MNERFQNALKRIPQRTPPIWLMRQAGRYHRHYQNLRKQHSFMELCKNPELAALTAAGPVEDFGFDCAILFSDLLFPLEALGMGLSYGEQGPKLGWHLTAESINSLLSFEDAWPELLFQKEALEKTRRLLSESKSLIGFVGAPFTLFAYAAEGTHSRGLETTKRQLSLFKPFCEILIPLLIKNIELQLQGGAEMVMMFDSAAGELSALQFQAEVIPQLEILADAWGPRLGYYSRGTKAEHLNHPLFTSGRFAGLGVDENWRLAAAFELAPLGFVQGNFDQNVLTLEQKNFVPLLERHICECRALTPKQRAGWICGLGHGVLPGTPEENVRLFVERMREAFE